MNALEPGSRKIIVERAEIDLMLAREPEKLLSDNHQGTKSTKNR